MVSDGSRSLAFGMVFTYTHVCPGGRVPAEDMRRGAWRLA